jgi:hypothetical protein
MVARAPALTMAVAMMSTHRAPAQLPVWNLVSPSGCPQARSHARRHAQVHAARLEHGEVVAHALDEPRGRRRSHLVAVEADAHVADQHRDGQLDLHLHAHGGVSADAGPADMQLITACMGSQHTGAGQDASCFKRLYTCMAVSVLRASSL